MYDPDVSSGVTTVSAAAMAVWLLQKAKSCKRLQWINENTGTLNRILAVATAGFAAIGVHWVMTGSLLDGGTITIAFPSLASMIVGLFHWFQQFAIQELTFQAVVRPAEKAKVVEITAARDRQNQKKEVLQAIDTVKEETVKKIEEVANG